MTKAVPQVSKYMTAMPHSIGPEQSIAHAKKTMQDFFIRHLPVRCEGRVVGVLTERDIDLISLFKDININHTPVKDAMTYDPYIVRPEAPLDEVCAHMAETKIGSALVVQENGTLVGIFTYVDALKVLAEIFLTRLKK